MNAYELADQLEKDWDNSYTETCNMLRQQADRIAELEKQLDETKLPAEFQKVLNDNLHELYETDEKQSEPVAWMYRVNYSFNQFSTIKPPDDAYDEGTLTPLYTTPQTKPLSDEEIAEIHKQTFSKLATDLDFARAIEAKALADRTPARELPSCNGF